MRLRDETAGFGVSLAKADLRLGGLDSGSVRPPLLDPDSRQLDTLARIPAVGRELGAELSARQTRSRRSTRVSSRCLVTVILWRPWGRDVREIRLIIVTVLTSERRRADGFSWKPTIGATAVHARLNKDVRSRTLGGPFDPMVVWDDLWRHVSEAGSGGIRTIAMAGLDLALHDLAARGRDLSLVDHLSRARDSAPVSGSGVNLHHSLDQLFAQAHRWVDAGFEGVTARCRRA